MAQEIDLKELERKAWRSTFHDGITDIGLGMMILAFATGTWLENIGIPFPWNILILAVPALLVSTVGKLIITRPRIGLVKFGPRRKSTQRRLLAIFIVTFLVTVILVILTHIGVFPGQSGDRMSGVALMSIIGLVTITFMGVVAYMLDFPRLFLIGVLIGGSVPVHELLHVVVGAPRALANLIAYGTAGGVIMLTGLVLLMRFLRAYPLLATEVSNVGE